MRPRLLLGAAAAATLGAALWWRKNPSACPYGQRFWVEAPHPIITRERLRSVLRPEPGERLLEIGVGTGYYSLELAEWIGPDGRLELFDLQQEFLDHAMRRAAERGLANLVATRGDATDLPYEDASVDAAVLTAVLGEIPDSAAALREIRRVLKPTGRLVVGELFGDPHFTTRAGLEHLAATAGLALEQRSGNWFGYFARLMRAGSSSAARSDGGTSARCRRGR
jgi:ubiquinone/menaquinone biosynthesis C-methylase UbiE